MRLEITEDCCAAARKLIAMGLDEATLLEFCRGEMVCLRGTARAFASRMVVETVNGPKHVPYRPFDGKAKGRVGKTVGRPVR